MEYTDELADNGRKGEPYPHPSKKKAEFDKPENVGFYLAKEDFEKFQDLLRLYPCEKNRSRCLRQIVRDVHGFYFESKPLPDLRRGNG